MASAVPPAAEANRLLHCREQGRLVAALHRRKACRSMPGTWGLRRPSSVAEPAFDGWLRVRASGWASSKACARPLSVVNGLPGLSFDRSFRIPHRSIRPQRGNPQPAAKRDLSHIFSRPKIHPTRPALFDVHSIYLLLNGTPCHTATRRQQRNVPPNQYDIKLPTSAIPCRLHIAQKQGITRYRGLLPVTPPVRDDEWAGVHAMLVEPQPRTRRREV